MSETTVGLLVLATCFTAAYRYLRPLQLGWRAFAWLVSRPRVVDYLIERGLRTPYTHIHGRNDVTDVYMYRYWLFNRYQKDEETGREAPPKWPWLPSIRVHHIVRPDDDEHMHDHPWDARTIILRGWYTQERPLVDLRLDESVDRIEALTWLAGERGPRGTTRSLAGSTQAVAFNSYHRISEVSPGGVYTLWFTWKYQGTWGFLVDGAKVPWRKYLGLDA